MCGRFTQMYSWEEVHAFLSLFGAPQNLEPRYNLAPTQRAAVVRHDDRGRRGLSMLRWGLIPTWAKDHKIGSQCMNARAETVATKPALRSAFKARRCLVPVSGYYEWTGEAKARQPHHIVRGDRAHYALAGLREWRQPKNPVNAEPMQTFSIVTTAAGEPISHLHDRMPVMVAPGDFDGWMAPATKRDEVMAIIGRATAGDLTGYAVSPRVNSVNNDERSLVDPFTAHTA